MEILINPSLDKWDTLVLRAASEQSEQVKNIVSEILTRVKEDGDKAIIELTSEIDKVNISLLAVNDKEILESETAVSSELKIAIEQAAKNIEIFHSAQHSNGVDMQTMPGVRCVQKSVPIQSVGLYVPGGTAPLFSTVLMLAIPAKVAGCKDIMLCTPVGKDGKIAPQILYAAKVCGVSKIYKVGGAQAIAAMAYGTDTVAKVDKIFGPGNRFVTEAKQQLSVKDVAIDMPAGPSEVMVLADETADADFVASDLLSQAEHGVDSQSILVCLSEEFAGKVKVSVDKQLAQLSRCDIALKALDNSKIIVFEDRENIIKFANVYAAEHLIISMSEPWNVAEKITAAGSVFIGNYTPESAGDYASGTNHTLPTSGWARAYSGVNLDSFMRKITYQEITSEGLKGIGKTIMIMADDEGLDAHKNAVAVRLSKI